MAVNVAVRWGCICKPGTVCAYHATLARVAPSGLQARLDAIADSPAPEDRREATIIRAELRERPEG